MWGIIAIQFILAMLMVFLTINLASLVMATRTGAPYVPSAARSITAMVKLADSHKGKRIAELGSGDGRVVRALAQGGATVDGYEIQPLLAMWSRLLNRLHGVSAHTRIYRQNLFSINYGPYDAVVIYGFPNMMQRLGDKFISEMKPGSRVVSHAFPIPGWIPRQQIGNVYLYEIGAEKSEAKASRENHNF